MAKIKVSNCADGKDSVCFITQTPFKTDKGVAYLLNGKIVSPSVALSGAYELEFDDTFILGSNFNSRVKVSEYLQALGIGRSHRSYYASLHRLADDLPLGSTEMGKNTSEHTVNYK